MEPLHLGNPCKPLTQGSNIFSASLDVNESQNMEVFVIKERYHCYHTKKVQKIKAQVIKHIYKKRKILPRVLK